MSLSLLVWTIHLTQDNCDRALVGSNPHIQTHSHWTDGEVFKRSLFNSLVAKTNKLVNQWSDHPQKGHRLTFYDVCLINKVLNCIRHVDERNFHYLEKKKEVCDWATVINLGKDIIGEITIISTWYDAILRDSLFCSTIT